MRRQDLSAIVLASLLSIVPATAQAALQRTGPVTPFGYPAWYQDASGLTMDFCSPTNTLELSGGWCLILPPAFAPETFPNQFFNEHFYWAANGSIPAGVPPPNATALLTLAVEGAFRSGPVIPGDQITFGRLRILIRSVPVSGTYTIYHPFGVWTFPNLVAGQKLFYTEDVGFNCAAGSFDCTLGTPIGPFLLPATTPGGPELPPIPLLTPAQDPFYAALAAGPTPYPGDPLTATPKYIADPARLGPVTGSPLPPFVSAVDGLTHNHNTFRIEVLAAGAATPTLVGENQLFALQGRVFEGAIPGQVTVERASYTVPVGASATGSKLDVFATGFPAIQARVPAGPPPQTGAAPTLQFWDAPCVLDPVTLLPIGGPAGAPHQLVASGSNYWGQSPPPVIAPSVCVAQTNAVGAGGALVTLFFPKNVEDEVTVSSALYDPTTTGFSLTAASSDAVTFPPLTLLDFGPLTGGTYTSTQLPAPATAHVTSAAGGAADFQVATALAAAASPVPVANNDVVTMFEDCSALPATSCATPQVVAPLANDTVAGAPIVFGPGVTVALVSAPRLGTAVQNLDGTFSYTPNPNANGTDGFSYTVSTTDPVTGVVSTSNIAAVSIVIMPVNDPPVAVNDTAAGFVTGPITIAVLANDTDPDGNADIVAVANLTQPTPAGATAVVSGKSVVVSATLPGTYTFTYQAQDTAGALSALPATVTVTVAPSETLTMAAPALFRSIQARWTINGTDSPPAGQLITLKYANGPNAGFVIGTATVDALGNWLFDVRGVTGLFNPTTAQATAVTATGPAGGTATVPIALK